MTCKKCESSLFWQQQIAWYCIPCVWLLLDSILASQDQSLVDSLWHTWDTISVNIKDIGKRSTNCWWSWYKEDRVWCSKIGEADKTLDVDSLSDEIGEIFVNCFTDKARNWVDIKEDIKKLLSEVWYTRPKIAKIIKEVYENTWSDKEEVWLFFEELKDKWVYILEDE